MAELNFLNKEPILKGWSEDKKYCVTLENHKKALLRVSPIERFEQRKKLFSLLTKVSELNVPMCEPISFECREDGVYTLLSWIEGRDAEELIPLLPETEQYVLGITAGKILKEIHSIPAPHEQEDWYTRFNKKTNTKMQKYKECPLSFDGDDRMIEYIEKNRNLLKDRPQTFQHGDYHIGNMMIENGELVIIDFDRYDFGDPWEEFNRIVWCAQVSPHFATGMVNGYFNGNPPLVFWKLLAFYIASNTLSSIYWSIPFGQEEVDVMMKQSQEVLAWFDDMRNPIPTWYLSDFFVQYIDGIPCKLKSPFDFSFLSKYGQVFKIYDDQDSGNICFGVSKDSRRYFVKFAGAPTERTTISAEKAIANLKQTVPIYQDLMHANLIQLIRAEEIGGGFAMVFDWVESLCMGRMYPLSRQKFMQLDIPTKLRIFNEVLCFHSFVAEKNYVAIDFYDGSILYDLENDKAVICDIDFYAKQPYINRMGQMWGSARFMSPEESTLGESINEVTNVYTMGRVALALFGDETSQDFEVWTLNKKQYDIAIKATNPLRTQRQQSIKEFYKEWNAAEL
ncbi:aminoglycoside phosphotransferase family protein [Scatolibacter rhodanostii]|uniref:aminoglycoside phosphotransferase family protein n=1 Tax=Scatolibacter rhodanostii TaxID=2014781 RepID=UPI000C07EAFE|nr:phosphotransferase [Scatolibacter rhodanostii]